jgi:hypothetical protein
VNEKPGLAVVKPANWQYLKTAFKFIHRDFNEGGTSNNKKIT